MPVPVQPLLHDEIVVFRAPVQAWSSTDGTMGGRAIHGHYLGDSRLTAHFELLVDGHTPEFISLQPLGADRVSFISLLRHLDAVGADPDVRLIHTRSATPDGFGERLVIESRLDREFSTEILIRVVADTSAMDEVKSGLGPSSPAPRIALDGHTATWSTGTVVTSLTSSSSVVDLEGDGAVVARTLLVVPARGSAAVQLTLTAVDDTAVVAAPSAPAPWSTPTVHSPDERLERWVAQALDDLDSLRLTATAVPGEQFLAAGAPWFFTLFGRDSIWAARFMLPLGHGLAASTLRVLAGLQGTERVAATAEQPGKIMHELRRSTLNIPGEGISLPPLYFGTVDATPLWVCLLHDAWRWGMPDAEVEALLPHLQAALAWMRDYGDADGDGLLEYVDETGHGLANQGWKDSGDSVQWRDGTLATGPIALCEVQAYAYEAATHGADLLEHFGVGEPGEWRAWAASLRSQFDRFWIEDEHGSYPAIALDADKKPVDTVTSNLGHLLGTGLLTDTQAAAVAARLVDPTLNSGYGLRTMSTDSAGYWPLSYHGGSVWTHDTAIAIAGLARDGFTAEAASLADGLLAAAVAFDYRMPELHSGDAASAFSRPVPYPAACRPQAWSAAAAIAVLASTEGLRP